MTSLLSTALARAQGFLLEPTPASASQVGRCDCSRAGAGPRPIEALVIGTSAGCGTTTVARGLALALTLPGLRPAHAVEPGGALPDGERPAAIVWDAGCDGNGGAAALARGADTVLLVAPAAGEPALVEVVARMLSERLGPVQVVANRVREAGRWSERAALELPDSRLGAALVSRGRRPPGALGEALARLARLVEQGSS